MARYRRYYRPNYTALQMSQQEMLSHTFGGIDNDIKRIFLSLPSYQLESIFERYGEEYGSSAELYARKTYEKWKTRKVRMSGQTAARLLNLVPPFLSAEVRFDLIKKLRAAHLHPIRKTLITTPQDWKHDLAEPIQDLVTRSANFSLPSQVTRRAAWLVNGDADAAQSLLAAAEQEEAIIRIRYLDAEFQRIETLIQNIENTRSVTHTIILPQGTIVVTITLPQKSMWQSISSWFS